MKTHTADYTANGRELIRYHKQLVATIGQTKANSGTRLYIAPGETHSMSNNPTQRGAYGEIIPSQIDMLQVLDNWVTGKAAPAESLMLEERNLVSPFAVVATRPICRYPAYPKYNRGDRTNGANFVCTKD